MNIRAKFRIISLKTVAFIKDLKGSHFFWSLGISLQILSGENQNTCTGMSYFYSDLLTVTKIIEKYIGLILTDYGDSKCSIVDSGGLFNIE